MLAIHDFHQRTPVRFRQYNPQTHRDYVYITGENTGCWSYVGRIKGVSNRVQGVVKTSRALRTAPVGFGRLTPHPKQIHSVFSLILNPSPTCEKIETVVSDLETLT